MNIITNLDKCCDLIDYINQYSKVYIYGAGLYAYYLFRGINNKCNSVIKSFVVSNKENFSFNYFCNKPVIGKNEIKNFNDCLFVIAMQDSKSVCEYLERQNTENIVVLSKKLMNDISEHIIVQNCELYRNMLDDNDYQLNQIHISNPKKLNTSRFTFLLEIDDLILGKSLSSKEFNNITEGPYEINEVYLDKNDIVFDIGAHVGIFSCIGAAKAKKVYAFEPCSELIPEILKQSALYDNRIIPVETALSDYIGTAMYKVADSQGMLVNDLNSSESTESVKVTTVDEYVRVNNIESVDFIKADIEGAEREMLRGAVETLKRFAPKLAICTYHLSDDKEVLEKIVKDANPNYNVVHKYKKMYCWVDNR